MATAGGGGGVFRLNMDDAQREEAMKSLRCFITMRAYDIISNGQYKKHVIQNKDNYEAWAVDIYGHYQKMMICLRNVAQLPNTIRTNGHERLAVLCQIVSDNQDAPLTTNTAWSSCFLTGVRCRNTVQLRHNSYAVESCSKRACLVMQGPTRRDNKRGRVWLPNPEQETADEMSLNSTTREMGGPVQVHGKFHRFVVSYWTISRFETLLKHIVRAWIQQQQQQQKQPQSQTQQPRPAQDYSTQCRTFSETSGIPDMLAGVFATAWEHVHNSVANLKL